MYGAILGDMIGAPYEFDRGNKTKEFPLFSRESVFTDDTAMTIAVAEGLMASLGQDDEAVKAALVKSMVKWGRKYPNAGYGAKFYWWLKEENPQPYGSFGNGSAMRVSSAGWLYDTLEETRYAARLTAEVSHNHPEGIKGAEATASVIYLARNGISKEEIKQYIIDEFGYDLSRTCDEIRPTYYHVETCQKSIPEAITAFLEGNDYEDVVRTAVSLGGDTDTIGCIAGGMAEAYYGIPDEIVEECRKRLPEDMLEVVDQFEAIVTLKKESYQDPFLEGNDRIEAAIQEYLADKSDEKLINVLETIRVRMNENGHLLIPVITDHTGENDGFIFQTLGGNGQPIWYAAFTSREEMEKGPKSEGLSFFIDSTLKGFLEHEEEGVIINPWGDAFTFTKEMIQVMFDKNDNDPKAVVGKKLKQSDLEDGTLLKEAVHRFNENRTLPNLLILLQLLRDSYVCVPVTVVMSEEDQAAFDQMIDEAMEKDDALASLEGKILTNKDNIRMIPDILQNGDSYFFPVFTSREEMGEYGLGFSTVEQHVLDILPLAENNEKDVEGLVINAFSEPCVIDKELFEQIRKTASILEEECGGE